MPGRSNPEQQRVSELPACTGCGRTMLLVGRESHPLKMDADLLTFECECGQTSVATTNN
jgi:hypothetical protein